MKTMKFFLMAMLAALTITACDSDDDVLIDEKDLPTTARTFLAQYFPSQTVTRVEKDGKNGSQYYDVTLSDGTDVEFDQNGNWTEIDCKTKAVPSVIIPQAITAYVEGNYPGILIVQIDREPYGYEIELSNHIDIKFDEQFNVLRIDR